MSATQQLFVSNAELIAAGTPIYNRFCDPTYAPGLGRTVVEAMNAGREEAFFAPAVNLAVNIALSACTQEEPFTRLPTEVSERAQVAQDIAHFVSERLVRTGRLVEVYETDEYLGKELLRKPSLADDLRDARYLPDQCEAPIREARRAVGGGHHALRKRGVNKMQADIVASSKTLPLVAHIPKEKEHASEVYEELGYPYIWPRHYDVRKVGGQYAIEFAPGAIDLIREHALPHRGCPAAVIYPYGRQLKSLLHEGWRNIVYYLLLPGATVKM